MKCPVCDQENSAMLCPGCGFDSSMDYGRYPTFAPVGKVPSVSARRREWQIPQQEQFEQIEALLAVLLTIQYRKIIEASPDLRNANRRIRQLEGDFLAERVAHTHLSSQLMNIKIEVEQENLEHSRQIQQLEQELETKSKALQESGRKLKKLNNRLQTLERKHKTILAEKAELEAALKVERSKGLISRIFNR